MRLFILNTILIVIGFSALGQGNPESFQHLRDSLKRELKLTQVDSVKSQILVHIAESFEYSNSDSNFFYGEKALQFAKKAKNIPAQMGAMSFMGYALLRQGNLPKALEMSLEAIQLGKDLPVRIAGGIGPVYSVLGEIYLEIGDFEKAKSYFFKMAGLGEGDIVGVAYGQFYLAVLYEKLNHPDSTNFYLLESYKTFGTLDYSYYPDVYNVYPPWYNLRAKIYLKNNEPDLALNDLFTSLKMTERNGDLFHVANACIDISDYYEQFNQQDSAIFYALKGMREANKINFTQGILNSAEILARLYESKDPVAALHYFKLAKETRKKLYGAGNIQIMRDMIAQEEKKQAEIEAARAAYQNRIWINTISGITFTLFVVAIFLFILIRRKHKAKQKIESAFDLLKSTQSQLIQSEKMASLGELTAGIAHEIQNPLNFVNNFSEVNRELITELKEEIAKGNLEEIKAITGDLEQNEEKISHHGKRADGIVKSMLQHSRSSSGQKEPVDLNALADEYLRLAFHGLKAKNKSFNADFNLEADPDLPKVNVVPQDIGRVLLNLINNAFFAVNERSKKAEPGYQPAVTVTTRLTANGQLLIAVKDNGPGIPEEIKDKIFQPFFTTKPTGEGTGLGLSLSYDIVTKGHGGKLNVNYEKGKGTEFIVQLPIN
ncbi:MAG: hypothetical protein K9H58_07120 [Bacteroidales bacterium]|nr:hypothetical protein [Bacteroidales bacterium]